MKRYAYGWITAIFFLVSIAGHWIFGWFAFLQDAAEHAQQPVFSQYAIQMGRDTLENWQSEFLQLFTMVVLTAFLIHRGSQQSKDSDEELKLMIERIERRILAIEGQRKAGE